jgi:hypothetical protein
MAAEKKTQQQSKKQILSYAKNGLWEEILPSDNEALNAAVKASSFELVKFILDGKYDKALLFATRHNHREAVPFILPKVKNVNACNPHDCSRTPLHYAAMNGMTQSIQLLLNAKAYINILNNDGCSPIDEAMKTGQKGTFKLLCEKGCIAFNPNNAFSHASSDSESNLTGEFSGVRTVPIAHQVHMQKFCSNHPEHKWIINSNIYIFSASVEKFAALPFSGNPSNHKFDGVYMDIFDKIVIASRVKTLNKEIIGELIKNNPVLLQLNQIYSQILNDGAKDTYIFAASNEIIDRFIEIARKIETLQEAFNCNFEIVFTDSSLNNYNLKSSSSSALNSTYLNVIDSNLYEKTVDCCLLIRSNNLDDFMDPMVRSRVNCSQQ